MKQLLAILILVVGVPAVSAQEESPGKATCSLGVSDAPAVGGLRLGMTAEQVLALFPGGGEDPEVRSALSKPPSPLGVSGFTIKPGRYGPKGQSAGVSQITLTLLDGRVSTLSVGYGGPEWPHVDQFVAKVVEGTNLPPAGAWQAQAGMDSRLKFLTCAGFEVRVFAGGEGGSLNYVLLSDLAAARTLKERRVKAREKVKQEPKP